jgi:hypothetical protein
LRTLTRFLDIRSAIISHVSVFIGSVFINPEPPIKQLLGGHGLYEYTSEALIFPDKFSPAALLIDQGEIYKWERNVVKSQPQQLVKVRIEVSSYSVE